MRHVKPRPNVYRIDRLELWLAGMASKALKLLMLHGIEVALSSTVTSMLFHIVEKHRYDDV